MSISTRSEAVAWLEAQRHYGGVNDPLTDEQCRCVDTLVEGLGRIYNIATVGKAADSISLFDGGISVVVTSTLATFDDDRLTRLVVAAHRNAVRVSVGAYCPHTDDERWPVLAEHLGSDADLDPELVEVNALEILLHARTRGEGHRLYEQRPTMVEALDRIGR